MANLVWRGSFGFNMNLLDVGNLYEGLSYTATSSLYSVNYGGGDRDEFRGHGFTFDLDGTPVGGVVTSYAAFQNGAKLGAVDGVSVAVPALVKAASTFTLTDDRAIFRSALAANDAITGGRGDDVLEGFAGNDRITGGLGGDSLYGGTGADRFVFKSIRESNLDTGDCDFIYGFSKKQEDKIDLAGIDANTTRSGNQAFSFIGAKAFSGKAGELSYEKVSGYTWIEGDVNGDGFADFSIALKGSHNVSKSYFYL
jgi:Ca2+-binding RTX toxin-like protein